jgi:TolB-like protein
MRINTFVSVMIIIVSLLYGELFSQENSLPNIAISDLIGQGVEQSEAVIVTEQLQTELLKSGKLRIIERSQMQEILKEQGFQQTGCTSDTCAVEIGQILGVKNIIVGTLGIAGSYTVLAVRVLDVATGAVTTSETVKTKGGVDNLLEEGIQEVAHKVLAGFLGEPAALPPGQQSGKLKAGKKALLWGGIGAVVIGGGVAALIILNDTNKDPIILNNVEIDLP